MTPRASGNDSGQTTCGPMFLVLVSRTTNPYSRPTGCPFRGSARIRVDALDACGGRAPGAVAARARIDAAREIEECLTVRSVGITSGLTRSEWTRCSLCPTDRCRVGQESTRRPASRQKACWAQLDREWHTRVVNRSGCASPVISPVTNASRKPSKSSALKMLVSNGCAMSTSAKSEAAPRTIQTVPDGARALLRLSACEVPPDLSAKPTAARVAHLTPRANERNSCKPSIREAFACCGHGLWWCDGDLAERSRCDACGAMFVVEVAASWCVVGNAVG